MKSMRNKSQHSSPRRQGGDEVDSNIPTEIAISVDKSRQRCLEDTMDHSHHFHPRLQQHKDNAIHTISPGGSLSPSGRRFSIPKSPSSSSGRFIKQHHLRGEAPSSPARRHSMSFRTLKSPRSPSPERRRSMSFRSLKSPRSPFLKLSPRNLLLSVKQPQPKHRDDESVIPPIPPEIFCVDLENDNNHSIFSSNPGDLPTDRELRNWEKTAVNTGNRNPNAMSSPSPLTLQPSSSTPATLQRQRKSRRRTEKKTLRRGRPEKKTQPRQHEPHLQLERSSSTPPLNRRRRPARIQQRQTSLRTRRESSAACVDDFIGDDANLTASDEGGGVGYLKNGQVIWCLDEDRSRHTLNKERQQEQRRARNKKKQLGDTGTGMGYLNEKGKVVWLAGTAGDADTSDAGAAADKSTSSDTEVPVDTNENENFNEMRDGNDSTGTPTDVGYIENGKVVWLRSRECDNDKEENGKLAIVNVDVDQDGFSSSPLARRKKKKKKKKKQANKNNDCAKIHKGTIELSQTREDTKGDNRQSQPLSPALLPLVATM